MSEQRRDSERHIVRLFEFFYNKKYKSSFKLDLSVANQRKVVENFVKLLSVQYGPEVVGINYLIDYFSFGFHYFDSKHLKRNISLNWIAGKKLLKRFIERKDGEDYYTKEWLRENSINLDELRAALVKEEQSEKINYLSTNPIEEANKSRLPDTEARLYSCATLTTLYNHRSPVCVTCLQKKSCKSILKAVNPILFKNRGY